MRLNTLDFLIGGVMLLTCTLQKINSTKNINEVYLEKLLQNVNTTADPCEDFFQYACGNWEQNYASAEYVDMPGYMDYKVNSQLLDILREHKSEVGIYEKVWHYYQSCEKLTTPALNPYLRLVEKELNLQWPIFRDDWDMPWQNDTHFDWLSTIAGLRPYGFNGVFITQNTNVRLTNGSHYLIEVHQHQSRHELKHKDIAEIFENFGMTTEQSENVTHKIIALEEQMKKLTMKSFIIESAEDDQRYKLNFKELTMKDLVEKVPNIDWIKYFGIILERSVNAEAEVIQTFALDFGYFNELLSTLNGTSNETICYYIMLKFMYQLNEILPHAKGKSTTHCIQHLRGYMPLAMNYFYEHHLYRSRRKAMDAALLSIYEKLRLNFGKLVDENFLQLNATEQAFILDELKTMKMKIGNIPSQLTQQFVEEYYAKISINASNFYANHLQLLRLITHQQQAKLLNQPTLPSQQFYEHDPETSSSSSPVKIFDNAILVPYGYLQLPFYHHDLNSLFQYSLFGFIIAHEIVHAYDLFHIVYDSNGNYNDLGIAVAQHFWQYIDCFAQSPSDSLSENIADVAGLRLVYQTYFDDVVNNLQSDYEFTTTNFTSQQLFFVNSVQFLCANMARISKIDVNTLNLEHDMHDVRVRQNWANFEEFAVAFQCANGTNMNPVQKCRLW